MLESLKPKFVIMLLFVVTVGIYYSSLLEVFYTQSILSIDDRSVMNHLFEHKMQLSEVFNPGWQKKYYRPMIDLSYLIDQRIYGSIPFGFRTTNVLIHSFNVILLYLTSMILLRNFSYLREVSFFSALLFAVHPLAVESVSWISGRTDLLATFFSLLAILCYLHWKDKGGWYQIPLTLIFLIMAILSKEVAVATPIVIALFELFYCKHFGFIKGKYSTSIFGLFLAAVFIYLRLRSVIIPGKDMGITMIESEFLARPLISVASPFFASFGFYVKKFLYPFPLNFMINQINIAIYSLLGLAVIVGLGLTFLLKNRGKYHFLLVWAMLGLAPAALISFTDIAWTHWAERYLYFSLVPFSLIMMMIFFSISDKLNITVSQKGVIVIVSLLTLTFAISTYKRSQLFNDNEGLLKDSYEKSPTFMVAATGYAGSLVRSGKIDEAERVLIKAQELPGAKHVLYYHLGNISREKANNEEAEAFYLRALKEARADKKLITVGPKFRKDILTTISNLNIKQAQTSKNEIEKRYFYIKGINALIEAYTREASDRFLLYKIAKLYLTIEEKVEAMKYLKQFIKRDGKDHYKKVAERLLHNLETKKDKDVTLSD